MSEIGMPRAGSDNQIVVREFEIRKLHCLSYQVKSSHLSE